MLIKLQNRKSIFKNYQFYSAKIVYIILTIFLSTTTNAQCAMCRAVLETSGNQAKAKGINDGIVYLMIIPYVLIGLVFFAVYKMYNKRRKA